MSNNTAFILEASDLLAEIEAASLSLLNQRSNPEVVSHLVSAFQTIRNSGAMLGFDQVATFTTHMEDLLQQVTLGRVPVNRQLVTLILSVVDQIKSLLSAARGGSPVNLDLQRLILESVLQVITQSGEATPAAGSAPTWQIRFQPKSDFLAIGGSPLLLFRDLKKLGFCSIKGHTHSVPLLGQMHPDVCYVWWTIELAANCTEADIRAVFISSGDRDELQLNGPISAAPRATQLQRIQNHVHQLLALQSRLQQAASPSPSAIQELGRLASQLQEDIQAIQTP